MVRKSMLAFVFAVGFGQAAQAELIAYWSGNGTATDSTGNHDGTLVNGAGYGAGLNGQQAFQFNGVNQYMSAPASTDFAFGKSAFSIGLWANFSQINNLPVVFIGNDEGPGNVNKWFFELGAGGGLGFHINSPGSGPIFIASPMAFIPTVGAWNYFAVTEIGGTYNFYVDGNSLGSATNGTSIPFANAPLTIGEAENALFFHGLIQDVQINSVPEPSSAVVASLGGLVILANCRWRSRRARV